MDNQRARSEKYRARFSGGSTSGSYI